MQTYISIISMLVGLCSSRLAVDLSTCMVKVLTVNEYLSPFTWFGPRHHTRHTKNTQVTNLGHLSTV